MKGVPCAELGPDPDGWPRTSLVRPPELAERFVDNFGQALQVVLEGDVLAAQATLAAMPSAEMHAWWAHAERAATARSRTVRRLAGLPPPERRKGTRQRLADPTRWSCFEESGWRCRYCGVRLIDPRVLRALRPLVETPTMLFNNGGRKVLQHGAIVLHAAYDHVEAVASRGTNDPGNLVAACGPCQYGKVQHSLTDLKLDDPRKRPATKGWNGLLELVPDLQRLRKGSR
jgi:hypothetical protein